MASFAEKKLSIFVHRASECLTDHDSHGDGLICFSLLNGLAERGHQIYAYANTAPIRECSPNLHIKTATHRVPANSLAPWEHSWRAERWMKQLKQTTKIDLVWRMHPYGEGCPYPPQTFGKPLVIGPLFSAWPKDFSQPQNTGMPRFGVSLQRLVVPAAQRGWQQTLQKASLLICATEVCTAAFRAEAPTSQFVVSPVIVELPVDVKLGARQGPDSSRPLRLLLAANFFPNKNVEVFCEIVKLLCEAGIPTEGIILGDGPGRANLERFIESNGLTQAVCLKGKLPHAQVWDYLRQADILVSCSGFEAYGRTIVEAMAVGTPVVAYKGSVGPAEIITDSVDGLLVDQLTATAFATRIQGALGEPDAWGRLSANALLSAANWRRDVVLDTLEAQLYEVGRQSSRGETP